MHHDLVDSKRWISERRFLHALNYCMVLPGPGGAAARDLHRLAAAPDVGRRGRRRAVRAALARAADRAVVALLAYGNVPAVAGVLYGIKPAVVAIVLHAAWRIGSRALKRPVLWVDRRARVRRDLRVRRAVSRDRPRRGDHRLRRRARRAARVRRGRRRTRERRAARAGGHRRRHADAAARALPLVAARAGDRRCASRCGRCALAALVARLRRRHAAAADGLVLQQGRVADVRRRLRGAALRLPGRGRDATRGSRRCR